MMNEKDVVQIQQVFASAPINDVFTLLDRVARRLREIQRLTVEEVNLTPPQFQTLRLLWKYDGQRFKDLAETIGCTRPTMTGIVDTLEKNALVRREPNPDDRRSLLVVLTEKGRRFEDSTPDLDSLYASCCSGLNAVEFIQLGLLLEKLDKTLSCPC
jgi:DNA-binding MarR family transcriptional regulator